MAIRQRATLVDLLDRVLDRGLAIDADVIISLAGVPLVGIKLRAALAGVETMQRFGVMEGSTRSGVPRESQLDEDVAPAVTSIGR